MKDQLQLPEIKGKSLFKFQKADEQGQPFTHPTTITITTNTTHVVGSPFERKEVDVNEN